MNIQEAVKQANQTAGYLRYVVAPNVAKDATAGEMTLCVRAEFKPLMVRQANYRAEELAQLQADLLQGAAKYARQRERIRGKHGN